MAEQIRTFIAIELDDAQKHALADLQSQLKRERASSAIRWTAAENIHLTLKFLGDMDSEKMPALQKAVADACTSTPPFVLKLDGAGAFPNLNRPNVVWVGVQGDVETASKLAQKIDDACAALGFTREERPFSPHLTLGRVKRDASTRERQWIGEMIAKAQARELGEPLHNSQGQVCRVERVSVMKSELRPGGSVYSRLTVVELDSNK